MELKLNKVWFGAKAGSGSGEEGGLLNVQLNMTIEAGEVRQQILPSEVWDGPTLAQLVSANTVG